jgi:hypothetical protein
MILIKNHLLSFLKKNGRYIEKMSLLTDTVPEWSVYDIEYTNQEHILFESSIVELCDIYGILIYYYILSPDFDSLYGEDQNKQYLGPYATKVIYQPSEEPAIFNTFGMYSDEIIEKMRLPKYTFTRDTSASAPVIGDIIRVPWNDNLFYEVVEIDAEDNIFQTKKFSWDLILRPSRTSEDGSIVDTSEYIDSVPISAYGDNAWIEEQSNIIDDYTDILPNIRDIYGYE